MKKANQDLQKQAENFRKEVEESEKLVASLNRQVEQRNIEGWESPTPAMTREACTVTEKLRQSGGVGCEIVSALMSEEFFNNFNNSLPEVDFAEECSKQPFKHVYYCVLPEAWQFAKELNPDVFAKVETWEERELSYEFERRYQALKDTERMLRAVNEEVLIKKLGLQGEDLLLGQKLLLKLLSACSPAAGNSHARVVVCAKFHYGGDVYFAIMMKERGEYGLVHYRPRFLTPKSAEQERFLDAQMGEPVKLFDCEVGRHTISAWEIELDKEEEEESENE